MAAPRLVQVTLAQTTPDFRCGKQRHGVHEIIYVLTRGYRVRVDGKTLHGRPGDVFFYRKRKIHAPLFRKDSTVRFYILQWQEESSGSRALPVKTHDASGRLLTVLRWMWELYPAQSVEDGRLLRHLLAVFLAAHRAGDPGSGGTFAQRAIHYMHRDIHRPLTLPELARALDVSTFTLIRRFRRETGVTPGRYLQRLRIERALNLVMNSKEPLKSIARAVGLSSTAHLCALIKRETGRTPGSFRGTS